jgi:ElaB/YqjD/DUF883 family membrane-anchored ribosome-binding protein
MDAEISKYSPNGQKAHDFNPSSGSNPSSGQAASSRVDALKNSIGDAMDRGKSDIADSAHAARDSVGDDLSKLKADLAHLQETVSKFATDAGGAAASTVKNVGQAVGSHVGSAAGEIATNATEQAKTFASELEGMARHNPLATLAGTLAVGVLVGMMTRGRA